MAASAQSRISKDRFFPLFSAMTVKKVDYPRVREQEVSDFSSLPLLDPPFLTERRRLLKVGKCNWFEQIEEKTRLNR